MFSFHKPKVFRSTQGCCICKAKSSSSRFTDSQKYEQDFIVCFQLAVPRKGEICNACVLLVKRFKRLPTGSKRHWAHVVDARTGPGLKSMVKCKKLKVEQTNPNLRSLSGKFGKMFKKTMKMDGELNRTASPCSSDDGSPADSPIRLDREDLLCNEVLMDGYRSKRKNFQPKRIDSMARINHQSNSFIDTSQHWKRIDTCCGTVFEHFVYRVAIIDLSQMKSCREHNTFQVNPITDTMVGKKSGGMLRESILDMAAIGTIRHNERLSRLASTPPPPPPTSKTINYLHKIKDAGKIVKAHTDQRAIALRTKLTDTNVVKQLLKMCAEKSAIKSNQIIGNVSNEKMIGLITGTGNKCNDNSSDSGYEEMVQESLQSNKKPIRAIVRPVILANGIKLHVQPENLALAANLAGFSQSSLDKSTTFK